MALLPYPSDTKNRLALIVNSYKNQQTGEIPQSLEDGNVTNAESSMYWFNNNSQYLDISFNEKVNIWRYPIESYSGYIGRLKIQVWNGANFVDFPQTENTLTSDLKWTKIFTDIPKGRYKLLWESGTYRADAEWFIEKIPSHKILLSSSNKNYSLTPPIYATETAVPQMTSAVSNIGEASADSYNNSDYPWNAFNGVANGSRPFWYTTNVRPEGGHWLQFNFFEPKAIYKISLKTFIVTSGNYSIKDFELYASTDGIKYTMLTRGTHPNSNVRVEYSFDNKEKYKYYRLNILNSYVSDISVGVDLLEMFEYYPSDLITLPNQSEQTFLKYGIESFFNLNQFNKTQNIESTSTTHESGKKYTHTVDLSKRRVDKILFS